MNSKPIFYSWDDVGSPGRNLTGDAQNCLKQILVACLVDGYGDKQPAGWEMVDETLDGFTLSNGTGEVNFTGHKPGEVTIYVAHGEIDITKNTGFGLRSLNWTPSIELSKHVVKLNNFFIVWPSFLKWYLVANGKNVILNLYIESENITRDNYQELISFGDFHSKTLDGSVFFALGGRLGSKYYITMVSDPLDGIDDHVPSYRHSVLEYIMEGDAGDINDLTQLKVSLCNYTDSVPSVRLGYLPGLCIFTELATGESVDKYINKFNLVNYKNIPSLVKIGGFNYSAVYPGSKSGGLLFCTDDPKLW